VAPDFVRDGSRHAIAEMVRSGTTCYNDMYFYPEVCGEVVAETGVRATLGMIVLMFPTTYVQGEVGTGVADEYMAKGRSVVEDMKKVCPDRIRMSWAPHAPYTVLDATWEKIRDAADQMNMQIHTHVHETQEECDNSEKLNTEAMSCHKSDQKCRPLENLQRMGLLTPRLIAAHMVCLTDSECVSVGQANMSTVHCPTSNLKLACGVSPVTKLLAAGANVALGTDGCCSNNTLDMFAEMKMAALVGKGGVAPMDASAVNAATAIRLATINGARALGLEKVTGSLVPGKAADMIAVRLDSVECSPLYSVPSHIVYTCGREHVTDVWVAGRCLMRHRVLLTMDEASVKAKSREWQAKIAAWAAEQ
jgi:5-methylthioadenosine/S-adenosylhomocysteine deaminase